MAEADTQPGDLERTQALQDALETPTHRIRRSGTAPLEDTSREKVSAPKNPRNVRKVIVVKRRTTQKAKTTDGNATVPIPDDPSKKPPAEEEVNKMSSPEESTPTSTNGNPERQAEHSSGSEDKTQPSVEQAAVAPGGIPTVKATAAKSLAAPKAEPKPAELKPEMPATPNAERLQSAQKHSMTENNLRRADTQDQLNNTPTPKSAAAPAQAAPSAPAPPPKQDD